MKHSGGKKQTHLYTGLILHRGNERPDCLHARGCCLGALEIVEMYSFLIGGALYQGENALVRLPFQNYSMYRHVTMFMYTYVRKPVQCAFMNTDRKKCDDP